MLVTPPPCGHPLYKQRGSLQSTHNKHIKNNPYIEFTLVIYSVDSALHPTASLISRNRKKLKQIFDVSQVAKVHKSTLGKSLL